MIDYETYFNQTAELSEFISSDNEYGQEEYTDPITIKCRIEGRRRFFRNDDDSLSVSEQSYWTTHPVKVRDRIDNQYVRFAEYIYDFDGSILYVEAYVWIVIPDIVWLK